MATKEHKRDKSEADSDSEPAADTATTTTSATPSKRKADVEELEVDLAAPEPPSKKAKRALKKGKSITKKSRDRNDDDLTKDGDEDEGETAKGKPARSEHGVWVGNLPFMIKAADLRQWLVDNSGGAITTESITRIHMPTFKEPGRDKSLPPSNKGFAYVDFSDLGGKVAAIALSETELNHRKLLIKDSTSFEGRPKKEPEPAVEGAADGSQNLHSQKQAFRQETEASRKIFVGNLSFKVTEDDVWRNFEKCGEIEFVKIAQFEDTGKCKGYGWVKFKEPEAAAWAVKGFVKVKEQVETEDDFKDTGDDEDRQKQFKTRKWWVNRMLGRELKLELAEDDQVRYKKRFGKDAPKPDGKGRPGAGRPRRDDGANSRPRSGQDQPLKESTDIDVARLTGAVVKPTGTKVTFD